MSGSDNGDREKQSYVYKIWQERAKKLTSTETAYDLTALFHGEGKHLAEVEEIQAMKILSEDTDILDVACGNGRFSKYFYRKVKSITGIDVGVGFIEALNKWKEENRVSNADFFITDLLQPIKIEKLKRQFDVVFLFGTSQFIIGDDMLCDVFGKIAAWMHADSIFLLKQTTSVVDEDVAVDKFSEELGQRWVAKYRTAESIEILCRKCGLSVQESFPVYRREALGADYEKVERWDNTKQMFFLVKKTPD